MSKGEGGCVDLLVVAIKARAILSYINTTVVVV